MLLINNYNPYKNYNRTVSSPIPFTARFYASPFTKNDDNFVLIDEIKRLCIKNLRTLDKRIVSGGTFETRTFRDLVALKKAGIEYVVDFRADNSRNFEAKCKKAGLKYFKFPLDDLINLNDGRYFLHPKNERMRVSNLFVSKLKEYFEIMNSQKAYVGCQYGIDRTNLGLSLNYLLNPNVNHSAPQILTWPGDRRKAVINKNTKIIKKILKSLTDEQKRYLGLSIKNNDFTNSQIIKLLRQNHGHLDTVI